MERGFAGAIYFVSKSPEELIQYDAPNSNEVTINFGFQKEKEFFNPDIGRTIAQTFSTMESLESMVSAERRPWSIFPM